MDKEIFSASKILKSGGVVVYPTETFYGLGADPFNPKAVEKIYKTKGRQFNKPLPLVASSASAVKRSFVLNKKELALAKKYWPGPLTLILKIKQETKLHVLPGKIKAQDAAVRISPNFVATKLARVCGGLIISTSANLSGMPACRSVNALARQFRKIKNKPDFILDAGRLPVSKPSTIARVKKNEIEILRQGEVNL